MKRIAIIGTAPASRAVAPFDDQSWDIWVCSAGNQNGVVPRVTCWFEIHAMVEMLAPENKAWALPYFAWLKAQTFPIYMQEPNDTIPRAIVFPYKKLIEHFGTRNWFTSTPAWMLAFAIYQMAPGDEIGIFGVDMASKEEYYSMQKGGLIFWIEKAQSLGIKVTIPFESCLGMPTPLYAYSEASRFGRRLNVMSRITKESMAALQQQAANVQAQINYHQGAIEAQDYFMRTALDGKDDAELDIADAKVVIAKAEQMWPTKGSQEPQQGTTFVLDGNGLLVPKGNPALGAGPAIPATGNGADPEPWDGKGADPADEPKPEASP